MMPTWVNRWPMSCLGKPVGLDDLLREVERVCGPPD